MRYNKFGKQNWDISVLGFGTIRLPVQESNERRIDEELAAKLIHGAIDGGVNYFDTGYFYNHGMGEGFLGRTLSEGKRQKVKIASKMPVGIIDSKKSMDLILNKQLKRLKTDHIEFYLFHSLNRAWWEQLKQLDPIEWAEKAIADGKIGTIGFSFHDDYKAFEEIITYYDKWGLCYIQYNYLDVSSQAGIQGIELAYKNEVPVIVMEPLKGGYLAKIPSPNIGKLWGDLNSSKSIVDLALQWIWDHKQVTSLLSGIHSLDELEQNLKIADCGFPGCLSLKEKSTIEKVKKEIDKLAIIPCTGCNYCAPCPNKISVSGILKMYNESIFFDDEQRAYIEYACVPREFQANNCTGCGKCESVCPQGIQIVEWLKKIHLILSNGVNKLEYR